MDIQQIRAAYGQGENLVNVMGKIYVMVGIDEHRRPTNKLELMDLHSGKRRTCSPDKIESVLGRVDVAKLPFRVRVLGPLSPEGYIQTPLVLPDGAEVQPGEPVTLWNDVQVVYLGVNPRNPRNPIMYATADGRTWSGPRVMFVSWAHQG